MRRSGTKSVARLRAKSQRPKDTRGSDRPRIDTTRNSSYVRRPVFDQSLEVVAYELVLGDGPITEIAVDEETGRFVLNTVVNLNIAEMSNEKPLQLTVASSVFDAEFPSQLAPENVALVLGAGIEPTPSVVSAVEYLHSVGYRIVLDDLAANPGLHQFLRMAHGVKVNLSRSSGPSLDKQIAIMKTAGVDLVADCIGSYDELRSAAKQGFTQFQGNFLSRPDAFRNTRAPAVQISALELVALLQDPDANISDIAHVIQSDVSLSYRILKVVNSAQYSLTRTLSSIEEAVMLVGTKQIVEWVGVISMSKLSDKPSELTRAAMIRARVCESLAQRLGRSDTQRFQVVGLFSVIEALLDVPAEKALASLPLSPEIADAIVSFGGIMGEMLKGVIAFEEGDWEQAHILGISDAVLATAFETATIETDKMWARISQ